MDGDEKVRVVPVRYLCSFIESHIDICGTCIDDLYIRILFLDLRSEALCNVQNQVLFIGRPVPAYATRVLSAVTCINDDRLESEILSFRISLREYRSSLGVRLLYLYG